MGSRAFRTPVRAGNPGADPGSICVRLLQAYHGGPLMGQVRDKSRRPCTDFPDQFAEAAGFAHVRPAHVAGPLASGRGLPNREPHSYPKMPSDRLPQFYLDAPTSASRPGRRYEKSPHGTRSGSVGILPLAYLAAGTSTSPHGGRARGEVSRQPAASAVRPTGDFRCVSRDTRTTSRNGVLRLFKARQKNRPFGVKSRHFPTLTPQTPKRPAGGSIPPIST